MDQMDYSNTSTELDNWFALSDPTVMFIVLGLYLLTVFKIGPEYMKNRPAYKFKTFITIYNLGQVASCIYVVLQITNITSTRILQFWRCSMFEKNTREEYLFNRLTCFAFWLKMTELIETVLFVLRKKQNQVTFLHVFHHCTTITLVYLLNRYYRGGAALYPLFLNSNVHIVMYSYYLAAAHLDENTLRKLLPIKKSITTIQMIQFCLILLQVGTMWFRCQVPHIIVTYYCSVVSVIFYGFYDFYKKSYKQRKLRS